MKALALLSGGLDSTLAVKIIQDQGIEVIALNFTSPFCLCGGKQGCASISMAKQLGIKLKIINKGKEYLKIIKNPKYGYGKNMNPCIDCRIFILKKAKQYAKKIDAKFIFTGEVLGQRPKSQHMKALRIIDKETGLKNKILRPLSAKLLPETEAEKKGWVNRDELLAISGRSRKEQISLAKKFNMDFFCSGGGCLLTYKEFSSKLRDLFEHKKRINEKDIELLKLGRHFRIKNSKVIVGRNKEENEKLLKLKSKKDIVLEVKDSPGPVTILQGKEIEKAAQLTVRYSDIDKGIVKCGKKEINAKSMPEKEIKKYRV